ncbi:MAG: endonuclease NucS domain-containing protein [Nostoc sp.]|uniref:endonuclease NucS domain-containing protein n=1 Tax=Nostoc sp. TaxID=1180 RepID=UPI002FFC29FD
MEKEYHFYFGGDRQLKLDSGRADIVTIDDIVELKRHTIDCNSVGQLLRYLKDTDRFRGKLVAPHIHADALNLISLLNEQGYEIKYINVILNNEYKRLHK